MPYPGTLLTSLKNDTANRLFNVAITRTQGKFLLVANVDYLLRKNISKKLIFTKAIQDLMNKSYLHLQGERLYDEIGTPEKMESDLFLGDRDDVDSWDRYLADIENAKKNVFIDIPGLIDEDENAITDFSEAIARAAERGVYISIRANDNITVPVAFQSYVSRYPYITMPITIIDNNIVWYGEPLSAADFISEGNLIETQIFPCLRIHGKYTSRLLKAFLDISAEKVSTSEVKPNV